MPDGSRNALVIGGASWNEMVYLDRFPEPVPHTVFAQRRHETIGSSGAGKALNLAALGWDVALWAPVGDDAAGRAVRTGLDGGGVDLLAVTDPRGTMRHVNLMDAAGDRISIFAETGTLDLVVDPEPLVERAGSADLVVVSIFEYCRTLLAPLRAAGVALWVDVHDYDGANPYHADFIDAATHLQLSSTRLDGWRAFAERRLDAGADTIVCTHGSRGASVATDAGWFEIDARPTAVVDTNGAGDAFFAGFADSWLGGANPMASGQAGAVAAAAAIASPDLAPSPG